MSANRWQFSTRHLLVLTAIVSVVLAVAVRMPTFFRLVLAFMAPEKFKLKTPQKDVSTYLFNKQAISHFFCGNCGIATHGGGVAPDGKRMVVVNLRCVPDVALDALQIDKFDGANKL